MQALVVYESMYGNTHAVAERIADGLRPEFDVEVVPVGRATDERLAAADLVVVGGPTHAHGMSSKGTRKAAAEAAAKPDADVELDADAMGPGLRDWFHGLGKHKAAAAAFDTRFDMPVALTGHAGRGIERRLRHTGFEVTAKPESFFVDKQNDLLEGEADRATEWAATLARKLCLQR